MDPVIKPPLDRGKSPLDFIQERVNWGAEAGMKKALTGKAYKSRGFGGAGSQSSKR